MKRLGGLLLTLGVTAAIVAFVVLMGSLIFPGALKWTAGTVCTDGSADPVVVRDTFQTEPGETSTNFTLYCVGERGEFEDAGFGRPLGVLMVWAIGVVAVPILALFLIGTLRRLVGGGSDGPRPEDVFGDGDGDRTVDEALTTDTPTIIGAPDDDFGGQPPLIS